MNTAFQKSRDSLTESGGAFFLVDIGRRNQTVKIVVDASAVEWIKIYKYKFWKLLAGKMGNDGDHAFREGCVVLYYFYVFVIPDILVIMDLLPERMNAALDIGAGIGLLDVFLYQFYDRRILLTMTEMDAMSEIDHVDEPAVPLVAPLHTLELLRNVVRSNDLANCDVISNTLIESHSDRRFDHVFSFRSWGYLYDLDEYMPYVNRALSENGVVITDLSNRYRSEEKFNEYFADCRIISEFGNGKRWIGHKK